MILYTPLSEADIFTTDPAEFTKRQVIEYNGRLIHAEQAADGSYRILQLLSTDPQDFLNNAFSPGAVISNQLN